MVSITLLRANQERFSMTSFRADARSRQRLSFDASDNSDIDELIELDGLSLKQDNNDDYQNRYRLIRIPYDSRSEHALRLNSVTDYADAVSEDEFESYSSVSEDIVSIGSASTGSISEEIVTTGSLDLDPERLGEIRLKSSDVDSPRENLSSVDSFSVSVNDAGTFFTPYLDQARADLLLEDFSSISTIGEEIDDDLSIGGDSNPTSPSPLRSEIPTTESQNIFPRSPGTENFITLGSQGVDQYLYLKEVGSKRTLQLDRNNKRTANPATDPYATHSGLQSTVERLSPVSA